MSQRNYLIEQASIGTDDWAELSGRYSGAENAMSKARILRTTQGMNPTVQYRVKNRITGDVYEMIPQQPRPLRSTGDAPTTGLQNLLPKW